MSAQSQAAILARRILLVYSNPDKEVSGDDVAEILDLLNESGFNVVDGGLVVEKAAGYKTLVNITDDRHFAHKKFVLDAIASGGSGAFILVNGLNQMEADFHANGYNLLEVQGITDSDEIPAIDVFSRLFKDSTGSNFIDWSLISQGLGFKNAGGFYTFLKGLATANTTQTFQNKSGIVAHIDDIEIYFKGKYPSLVALQTAHPTAEPGDYAIVAVNGDDDLMYIWDDDDADWVETSNTGGVQSFNGRIGVVMPASDDYDVSQVTGAFAADGSILPTDNWDFNYKAITNFQGISNVEVPMGFGVVNVSDDERSGLLVQSNLTRLSSSNLAGTVYGELNITKSGETILGNTGGDFDSVLVLDPLTGAYLRSENTANDDLSVLQIDPSTGSISFYSTGTNGGAFAYNPADGIYFQNANEVGGYISNEDAVNETVWKLQAKPAGSDYLEAVSNKATNFSTKNNTLYPSTAATATLVNGRNGFNVNDFTGVDPTGATDSTTGINSAITAAGTNGILHFSGDYHTNAKLQMLAGQRWIFNNANITLDGNTASIGAIEMADNSVLDMCSNSIIKRGTGVSTFSGVYVSAKYGWKIKGGRITGWGNQAIRVSGSPSTPSPYGNGFISGVNMYGNLNNGSGGTNGNGHGVKLENGAEYVTIENCWIHENAGFGILNVECGNSPIINNKIMKNTLGGMKIIGIVASGNTDHFHISGNHVNHNDTGTNYNFWFQNIRYGVNITGGSSIGGVLVKAENSKNIVFTGCGLGIGGANYVDLGAQGNNVSVVGGYTMSATQAACQAAIINGGVPGSIDFNFTKE